MEINAAWKGLRKGRAESNFLLSCGDEKFFAAASVLVGRILTVRTSPAAPLSLFFGRENNSRRVFLILFCRRGNVFVEPLFEESRFEKKDLSFRPVFRLRFFVLLFHLLF